MHIRVVVRFAHLSNGPPLRGQASILVSFLRLWLDRKHHTLRAPFLAQHILVSWTQVVRARPDDFPTS